ncbi:MAG: tRNA (adenosine(37)-N6)-threonylcarbamoyltransferase complex ATPase subunit type 1 TsaE [Dehalococcoidia bacterium]
MLEIVTRSPEQTQQIGTWLGEMSQAGDLILLTGELGAGKTCLTQGIARGLGFEGFASSPSFVLVREYPGRLMLYHVDLYRLDDMEEIAELGLDDYLAGEGVCVVEWADKAGDYLPFEHLSINLVYVSENERLLKFQGNGARYIDLIGELEAKWNWQ